MSNPGERHSSETKVERIPTLEEIYSALNIVVGKEYGPVVPVEDEKGVCRIDATVRGEREGEIAEYTYTRKDSYQGFQALITVFYSGPGDYMNGGSVAEFTNGKWEFLSWKR